MQQCFQTPTASQGDNIMRTLWTMRAGAVTALLLALLASPAPVWAQPDADARAAAASQAAQLAKQTQNPVSSLISVPFQGNWDMGIGDSEATGTLLNFQPVVPFGITPSTNVILRVIMPLASQPAADGTRVNALGDIVMSAFFSPAVSGKVIWGVGPVLLLPTATNNALGTEKFGIGPTAVVLTQPGPWTVGLLFNQIWSVSGATDRKDVNTTYLQPFLNYNLGHGLAVGAVMEASANWNADQEWTAPLLFMVSKVAMLGKRPVNFQFMAGPMVASPDGGANWRFRFVTSFMFPR
jgi:hypothetical protein